MQGELTKAVCKVMEAVQHVQKTGYNSFSRYNYASDADLLRALQPAMAANGLAMCPIKVERSDSTRKNAKGKDEDRADVLVTYRLMHSSGEHVDIQAPGTGMDALDKAPYKAMTGAFKYALRQTFAIPTGDDPENDGSKQAPPRKNPESGKAPEWKALMAAIGSAGLKYDDFRDWCEDNGWGRVDSWTAENWAKAAKAVVGDADKVRAWTARNK